MNKIFKINHQIQNSDKCLYNTTVNIYFSTLVWTEAFYFVYNWFKTNMYVIRYNSAMKSKYYNSSLIFLGFFAGFFFFIKNCCLGFLKNISSKLIKLQYCVVSLDIYLYNYLDNLVVLFFKEVGWSTNDRPDLTYLDMIF